MITASIRKEPLVIAFYILLIILFI